MLRKYLKVILLPLSLFGTFQSAYAQPVPDATSTAGSTANPIIWSHTNNGNAMFIFAACRGGPGAGAGNVSAANFNGVSASAVIGAAVQSSGTNQANTEIWYVPNPTTGTHSVSVSLDANNGCRVGAITFSNVDVSGTPYANATGANFDGTATQPSLGVTSAANDYVIDVVVDHSGCGTCWTEGAGQTLIFEGTNPNSNATGAASYELATGASTTMSWTGATVRWAQSAVAVKPVPTGGGGAVKHSPVSF